LIDDYIRHDLSESEREAFETNFLQSESRREKVASAASLWRVANEQQTKVLAPGSDSADSLWDILTSWKVIGGFAALLFVCGLVYVGFRSGTSVEPARVGKTPETLVSVGKTVEPAADTSAVTSPVSDTANVNVVTAKIPTGNATSPAPSPRPVALATFTLSPGALRDEGEQSINIPANASSVDLRLVPAKNAPKYGAYSITLKTADGETIRSLPEVRSLKLRLSAKNLENRTYIVFLEGLTASGSSEPVAEYTFRVRH
jgi:hypothetical protein